MTILPNKKSQASGGNDNNGAETANSVRSSHHGHHQQLASSIPPHLQSVSKGGVHEDCNASRQSSQIYDDDQSSGSGSSSGLAGHSKRRAYRTSPLSIRPKLRDHRVGGGSASPTYAGGFSVNQHPMSPHSHSHQMSSSSKISPMPPLSPKAGPSSCNASSHDDEHQSGYNSGDEYQPMNWNLSSQEWTEKERWFEKKMKKKGLMIKKMQEDGACLFSSIFSQQEANKDMFSPFVSEDYQTYVTRKRQLDVFGNHVEIAAMSEMYNRVIEVYCYSTEPINIFQSSVGSDNPCIRLSYHSGTHYNSLIDPLNPSCGVGLGLPNLVPGLADKTLMKEATRQSENLHLEQAMLEDKLRATDYEATADAIEEQVASESYLDYLRDLDKRNKAQHVGASSSSSVPSDSRSSPAPPAARSSPLSLRGSPTHRSSPTVPQGCAHHSPHHSFSSHSRDSKRRTNSARGSSSPKCKKGSRSSGKSKGFKSGTDVDNAVPGPSKDPSFSPTGASCSRGFDETRVHNEGDFAVDERASFLNHVPHDILGLSDYSHGELDVLAQVLAQSQEEYLNSLKKEADNKRSSNSPPLSFDSQAEMSHSFCLSSLMRSSPSP
ncbi:OTU domain-containing protein 5-B isoform X2 [Hyalella azteca]|uniref:ubiquitinyl hydrolase 1 n=1 Tax=Hyalella azteca TaxID=294128 RepID=A0A979FQR4_HYAAZ|nr:OTU domain-containing protein 5-B isoform X2 [Hyalella azteca]